ncbi:MAG: metal ABC transporter permease [Verrucomicrobiia bacterium]|jgi:ABC-type Mn2+/Zn2+ transport system permease subunit
MVALHEILASEFLLRDALHTVVLVGLACPLIGVFFILRRLVFLGVALPQISSTGVALALSLHVWFGEHQHGHHHTSTAAAFSGALVFSMLTVVILTFLERRRNGIAESWLGTAFVVSTATSLLLIAKCPQAEQGWLDLFRGEVIAITRNELQWTSGIFALVLSLLAVFRREFLLVSYDWRLAATLGISVFGWDLLLFSLIGVTVAATVMTVGPLIAFGFMIVPTLISQSFCNSLPQLLISSSLIGGGAAFAGFYIAYRWDFPVGPAAVGLLGILFLLIQGGAWIASRGDRR